MPRLLLVLWRPQPENLCFFDRKLTFETFVFQWETNVSKRLFPPGPATSIVSSAVTQTVTRPRHTERYRPRHTDRHRRTHRKGKLTFPNVFPPPRPSHLHCLIGPLTCGKLLCQPVSSVISPGFNLTRTACGRRKHRV